MRFLLCPDNPSKFRASYREVAKKSYTYVSYVKDCISRATIKLKYNRNMIRKHPELLDLYTQTEKNNIPIQDDSAFIKNMYQLDNAEETSRSHPRLPTRCTQITKENAANPDNEFIERQCQLDSSTEQIDCRSGNYKQSDEDTKKEKACNIFTEYVLKIIDRYNDVLIEGNGDQFLNAYRELQTIQESLDKVLVDNMPRKEALEKNRNSDKKQSL